MNKKTWLEKAAPGIADLHPYIPGKPIEELERELGLVETIKLASNENPLGPSPLAWSQAQMVLGDVNLYPDDSGYRLRNCLAEFHGVSADAFILGAGSSDVLNMVARAFLSPGVNAVISAHSFAMYAIYTQACGAAAKVADPLPADHVDMPYGHDLDAMLAQVDDHTRVIFIANPNNPTGTWLQRDELKGFLDRVPSDVVVVLDEAYTQYVEDDRFPDGIEWIPDYPNLIVTRTFSKIYGLAGLRVGYGIASPDLLAVIGRLRAPFNVSLPALAAAEKALEDGEFLKQSILTNREGMQQLEAGLDALGLKTIPSVGNFLCVEFERPGIEIYESLLKKGIIVRPVANYQLPNHLRITIGSRNENKMLLNALNEVLSA